jgi:hypothetical protein
MFLKTTINIKNTKRGMLMCDENTCGLKVLSDKNQGGSKVVPIASSFLAV